MPVFDHKIIPQHVHTYVDFKRLICFQKLDLNVDFKDFFRGLFSLYLFKVKNLIVLYGGNLEKYLFRVRNSLTQRNLL